MYFKAILLKHSLLMLAWTAHRFPYLCGTWTFSITALYIKEVPSQSSLIITAFCSCNYFNFLTEVQYLKHKRRHLLWVTLTMHPRFGSGNSSNTIIQIKPCACYWLRPPVRQRGNLRHRSHAPHSCSGGLEMTLTWHSTSAFQRRMLKPKRRSGPNAWLKPQTLSAEQEATWPIGGFHESVPHPAISSPLGGCFSCSCAHHDPLLFRIHLLHLRGRTYLWAV